jgi:site-specific DNA recombinase
MPELRRQDHAIQAELQSLEMAAGDQTKYLRLVETLGDFRARLRARANMLDVKERQKILRLLVKEVLVGKETITIRHSIRLPTSDRDPNITPRPPHERQQKSTPPADSSYLLRSGSNDVTLRK